jgi:hypothetical protein
MLCKKKVPYRQTHVKGYRKGGNIQAADSVIVKKGTPKPLFFLNTVCFTLGKTETATITVVGVTKFPCSSQFPLHDITVQ